MRTQLLILLIVMATVTTKAQEKKTSKVSSIVLTIDIDASVEKSFEYIVPVDLSHIFNRHKSFAGIDSTSNEKLWYTPGMERTVYFDDGTTAQEYLLTVEPHASFSYRIQDFTHKLKYLAKHIEGKWQFTSTKDGKTHVEWTYTIVPKNGFTRMIFNTFVKRDLQGLLNNALLICKQDLEKVEQAR